MDLLEQMEHAEEIEIPGQLAFFPESHAAPAPPRLRGRSYPQLTPLALNDPHLVSILLCSVLHRFDGRMPEHWLYESIVASGHVSYFLYADALGFLLENGSFVEELDAMHRTVYYLTERGTLTATRLRQYVPKPFRDRVMLTALRYVSRQKALQDLALHYEPEDGGCALCLSCRDGNHDMFSLRIHAPSVESAQMLGERILRNPAGFFGKIIDIAMNNEEEEFDLTDN